VGGVERGHLPLSVVTVESGSPGFHDYQSEFVVNKLVPSFVRWGVLDKGWCDLFAAPEKDPCEPGGPYEAGYWTESTLYDLDEEKKGIEL
jgi:hypothetical protein